MHIQNRIDVVIKLMLLGADLLHQFFQRPDIVLVKLQFRFLLLHQNIILSPVNNSPDLYHGKQ